MFMPLLCAFLRAARERQCVGQFEMGAQLVVDLFGGYTRLNTHAKRNFLCKLRASDRSYATFCKNSLL